MENRRLKLTAGIMGVSAGLAPYLPTVVCGGVPCTSCFACVGAGGAAASALIVGLVSRRMNTHRSSIGKPAPAVQEGGTTIV